jgi:tetratricopeptide (TPR) repeat protein
VTRQASRTICFRAAALCDVQRYDDALQLLHDAVAADPTDPQPYCLMSRALYEADQHARAEEPARRALALDSSNQWALRLLALSMSKRPGGRREAVTAALNAVMLGPNEPMNHLAVAKAYEAVGSPDIAARAVERGLELAPTNPALLETAGLIQLRAKHLRRARRYFVAQRKLAPTSWTAHNNLGAVASNRGRHVVAVRHFMRSIRIAPKQVPIVNLRRSIGLAGGFVLNALVVVCAATAASSSDRADLARLLAVGYVAAVAILATVVWWRSTPTFRRALRNALPAVLAVVGMVALMVTHRKGHAMTPLRERWGAALGMLTIGMGVASCYVPAGLSVPLAVISLYQCGMVFALLLAIRIVMTFK